MSIFRCAAVRYRDEDFLGANHGIAFHDELKAKYPDVQLSECTQGFMMRDGTFLDSESAKKLAHQLDIVRPGRDKFLDKQLHCEYLPAGMLEDPKTGQPIRHY